jgi:deoxyribodipyrimidine photo-lyase
VTAILWHTRDLRLTDNRALQHAARAHDELVPVYAHPTLQDAEWGVGAAQAWWLAESLEALDEDYARRGLDLVLLEGSARESVPDLAADLDAAAVHATRPVHPDRRDEAAAVREHLDDAELSLHGGRTLHDPDEVETTSGGPYHVFTPFWKRFQSEVRVGHPQGVPPGLEGPDLDDRGAELADVGLGEAEAWHEGLAKRWTPGEAAALDRLEAFVEQALADYPEHRDPPAEDGTARLSPHLALGEVSPRTVWHRVDEALHEAEAPGDACREVHRQLCWREFAYHLLHHYPKTRTEPLRDKYRRFPWREDREAIERWKRGRTGYPFVDAGMRELWATGWMHNRVRMVAASFLTKHLLVPWQVGARWFWYTLVDADLANNTLGWQWAAGCGADAQPFFRIFNPIKQGRDHDPGAEYTKRWVPELADLPVEHVHAPWEAPPEVRRAAGVELGADYPEPIVDHSQARERALDAYDTIG